MGLFVLPRTLADHVFFMKKQLLVLCQYFVLLRTARHLVARQLVQLASFTDTQIFNNSDCCTTSDKDKISEKFSYLLCEHRAPQKRACVPGV